MESRLGSAILTGVCVFYFRIVFFKRTRELSLHDLFNPRSRIGNAMSIVLATSVWLGGQAGESHGAAHLVDFAERRAAQLLDWKSRGPDWQERGGGRGLRGVAIDGEEIWIAASDALHQFSRDFELKKSFRAPFLADCQEIAVFERRLYVVSAAFDSILGFDLEARRFDWGLHIHDGEAGLLGSPFEPHSALGPSPAADLQLNSVYCDPRGMFISGARTQGLLHFDARRIVRLVSLPRGVHNARPWRDGVLFNDTEAGVARFMTPGHNKAFRPPLPGFARGLCVLDGDRFASGSAPATVTLHDLEAMKTIMSITLADNPRHSIHSLVPWPFPA